MSTKQTTSKRAWIWSEGAYLAQSLVGSLLAILGAILGIVAWLAPFSPVGPSINGTPTPVSAFTRSPITTAIPTATGTRISTSTLSPTPTNATAAATLTPPPGLSPTLIPTYTPFPTPPPGPGPSPIVPVTPTANVGTTDLLGWLPVLASLVTGAIILLVAIRAVYKGQLAQRQKALRLACDVEVNYFMSIRSYVASLTKEHNKDAE